MVPRPRRAPLAITRPGLVVPVRRDPAGLTGPTAGQARGRSWRGTSWGFYVPSWVDGMVPEQRIVEAAVVLPSYGGVTGWASLRWWGGVWFDGFAQDGTTLRPVPLAVSECDIRSQAGIQVAADALDPCELVHWDGLPTTSPRQAVLFELCRAADVRQAVLALDMACYSDLVSIAEVSAHVARQTAITGIIVAREAVALADENSWSPQESRMRLAWRLDAGLPPPLCNVPVFDRPGDTWARRTCSTPSRGSRGSTTAHCTSSGPSADATATARRGSEGWGWSTFRSSPVTWPIVTGRWR